MSRTEPALMTLIDVLLISANNNVANDSICYKSIAMTTTIKKKKLKLKLENRSSPRLQTSGSGFLKKQWRDIKEHLSFTISPLCSHPPFSRLERCDLQQGTTA